MVSKQQMMLATSVSPEKNDRVVSLVSLWDSATARFTHSYDDISKLLRSSLSRTFTKLCKQIFDEDASYNLSRVCIHSLIEGEIPCPTLMSCSVGRRVVTQRLVGQYGQVGWLADSTEKMRGAIKLVANWRTSTQTKATQHGEVANRIHIK